MTTDALRKLALVEAKGKLWKRGLDVIQSRVHQRLYTFIAAASPGRILAVLDENAALKRRVRGLERKLGVMP